jgi:SAM-dependent methyltransferase
MTGTLLNAYVQPHNQRAAAIWSAGGKDYDQISRGSADAIEHCVFRLDPRPGEQVLDLSTGTGWASRLVARRGSAVVAVDIASDLLDAARARAAAERLRIDYQLADAENLPFEDATFDAVISTFGIMFANRPAMAAAELARVCRPGGRIALTTWLSDSNLFRMVEIMKRYMPSAPAAAPSPFEWGRTGRVRELLGEFFDLRFEQGISYYREPTADAAWDTYSRGYGPTKSLAADLTGDRLAALRADFIAFHAGFPTELGISVPRAYWLTSGRRR